MPRYYFDTDDGDTHIHDDEGMDLPSNEDARQAALAALPDIAKDKLPDGDRRDFIIDMRDQHHRLIYTATLSLVGRWVK